MRDNRNLVEKFIDMVRQRDELQNKYFEKWQVSAQEKEKFNFILLFFVEECGYSMTDVVDSYVFINEMVREETYYFIKNAKYRNSTFTEVNKIVYDNPAYMEKYMMGLSISDYIWINHIKMLRYFEKNSSMFHGKRYLEIGPGLGQYLIKAIHNCKFDQYCACDISKTSVEKCNKYLAYRHLADQCTVIEKDFFQYTTDERFDCVVMGEVLAHVEQPEMMMKKICNLLTEGGTAFITTVINAPAVDHISLFGSIEQVLDLAKAAGFTVVDYMYATEGDISLDKAVKRRQAINIAMILQK